MERLTKRNKDGTYARNNTNCPQYTCADCPCAEECDKELFERLALLEDKLESGQMVELPCIREVKDQKGIKYHIYFNDKSDLANGAISYYATRDKSQAEARLKELQEK